MLRHRQPNGASPFDEPAHVPSVSRLRTARRPAFARNPKLTFDAAAIRNGMRRRQRVTETHRNAAPAAAQRRDSKPKAETAGSTTRRARAHAQRFSRACPNECALPRPPRPARDSFSACARLRKPPLIGGLGGETLNPKRLHSGWSGAGMRSSERARPGQRSPPTILMRGGSQPARAFSNAGPKP